MIFKKIVVAGSGKLAKELLSAPGTFSIPLEAWDSFISASPARQKIILVHAGSGRQAQDCQDYCARTASVYLECATHQADVAAQSGPAPQSPAFTLVECPNLNLLNLRLMLLFRLSAKLFKGGDITLEESHQEAKTTPPGTALEIAASLGMDPGRVVSYRNPQVQETALGIPAEALSRHAFHRFRFNDGPDNLVISSRIISTDPYARGLAELIRLLDLDSLKPGRHHILDLLESALLA